MNDPKRATELYLQGKLTALVAGHPFYPYSGGSSSEDSAEVEPPFTIIAVTSAEKSMAQAGTWVVGGTVQTITHAQETPIETHSALARQVYIALSNLARETTPNFILHGIDIASQRETTDDASQCHATVTEFTAGISG